MLVNPEQTKNEIVQWIRDYFEQNGPTCHAVVGISGGKDSTVVAALCKEALGADRVIGVLMPNGSQSDIHDSYRVCELLGISHFEVNIGSTYNAICQSIFAGTGRLILPTSQAGVNLPARLRMVSLYAVAQSLPSGGRVANTCNYSEDFVGYSTKFGDSAGDFSPLANLMVHEVRQIGQALGLPDDLIFKTPSDGLCGKSDEDNLGFTYEQLDTYISEGSSGDAVVNNRIQNMHSRNLHKLQPMPSFLPDEVL